jgi:uncharacterized membrane protein YkvA (DUF1232 family)
MDSQIDPQAQAEYSEDKLWNKVAKYAKKAGSEVIEKVLWLYYAAQSPDVPLKAKTIMYGALGYFIMPLDVVPDIAPVVGYSDDLGVLVAAIAAVSMYINDEIKEQARQKMQDWFG